IVAFLKLAHDRDQGVGLGLVSFETADLQRKSSAVDEQSDHNLRIDPPLFGIPDLAEVVLLLCLEVQGGDVEQKQPQSSCGSGVFEAMAGNIVAVSAG